ncbi:MAG: ribosome-associated translation inhibitor RaiA [Neisseriaceae bacterium]|nr:ribosome-associated translation inhibitor RaiA [Neisseriaceae bacterium]
MDIKVIGLHLDVTPALRQHVEHKLNKVLSHTDTVISVSVNLSVDKLVQKSDLQVHLVGKDIHVEGSGTDMYGAIDDMVDKFHRQVIKYKEKLSERRVNVAAKDGVEESV